MKEQKKTGKTKTKNTETIIKKQNNIIKDIEKRKPIELKQSKEERYGREKFNIFAKAKQQLIQCEIIYSKLSKFRYNIILIIFYIFLYRLYFNLNKLFLFLGKERI